MKKLLFTTFLLSITFSTYSLLASTPIQFSFWPGADNWPEAGKVEGVKVGVPYSSAPRGVNQQIEGLETSIVTETQNSTGAQLSVINLSTYKCSGFQFALVTLGEKFIGFQWGLFYTEMEEYSEGFQMSIVNNSRWHSDAVQLGIVNNSAKYTTGGQVGLINASRSSEGFQVGVLNSHTKECDSGWQVGLINYMKDGFVKIFPFFNFKP